MTLRLYTRPGCIGCDVARDALAGQTFTEIVCGNTPPADLLAALSFYDLPIDNVPFPVLLRDDVPMVLTDGEWYLMGRGG